jgi:transcriptional regulator
MYCPAHFEEARPEALHALLRSHPLATLITQGTDGLQVNLIPLLWRPGGGQNGTLVGHVARANPLWHATDFALPVTAVFHGPQGYISPSWYATKAETGKVVPTWNYALVQATGELHVHDDPAWVHALVTELTQQHEAQFAAPWAVSDAPGDYVASQLRAIVGIEIALTALVGKFKLSQNQPERNRAGVQAGLPTVSQPGTAAQQLADWVHRAGPDLGA